MLNENDFTLQRTLMIDRANKVAASQQWHILNVRFLSNPKDSHLMFVTVKCLDKSDSKPFATALFNNSSSTGFFVEGHYDFETEEAATNDMVRRR